MPSIDDFMESCIHEKKMLIQIQELKNSKPHVLTTQGITKKNKQKNKGEKEQEKNKEHKSTQMRIFSSIKGYWTYLKDSLMGS